MADLWLAGRRADVRRYNEADALATYVLWLRAARLAGLFSAAEHAAEEGRVERLLEREAGAREPADADHLRAFLDRWRAGPADPLRARDGDPDALPESDPADAGVR